MRFDTEGADQRMIKADENQMEGLHPMVACYPK
jgi:hypothetical protein